MNRQAFFFFNYLIDVGYIKGSSSISGDKVGSITITPEGYKGLINCKEIPEKGVMCWLR